MRLHISVVLSETQLEGVSCCCRLHAASDIARVQLCCPLVEHHQQTVPRKMLVLKAQSNLGGSYQKLKHVQKDRTEVKISPQKAKPHIENKGSHRRLRHAQKAQKKLQKAKAHTENRDPHRR